MKIFLLGCVSVLLLTSCNPQLNNHIWPDDLKRVFDFQDHRTGDSLLRFLNHPNEKVRRATAAAFASIQDTAYSENLGELLLSDQSDGVKANAAFSLGQTRGLKAARYLFDALRAPHDEALNEVLWEAVGKTDATDEKIDIKFTETSWYWYRRSLANEVADDAVEKTLSFLHPDQSFSARLGAAHFFARGKVVSITKATAQLMESAKNDREPEVRMAAALALSKAAYPTVRETLELISLSDPDYRVRTNAIRSLSSFVAEGADLFRALKDTSLAVQIAAAEGIRTSVDEKDCRQLKALARSAENWRVQSLLYESIIAHCPDRSSIEELDSIYGLSNNVYQRASILTALGKSSDATDVLLRRWKDAEVPVIRSSGALALAAVDRMTPTSVESRRLFLPLYRDALLLDDPAVTGIVADVLMDSTRGYKSTVTDLSFLYEARDRLRLPNDLEAYQALDNCIGWFEGRPAENKRPEYNHPIQWDLLDRLHPDQKIVIHTTRGRIVIRLLPDEAPGSVANFVDLSISGYFNGRFFHRVVPNFVIQTGCPRGDGWGGEDYTIRSEFTSRRYTTGAVGMASAGKDTEGTQWFITHSPAPHLEGRYSLFAVVVSGMDVVHQIEVGDQILKTEFMPALPSF